MFAALFLVSCFGDSTGLGERRRAGVAFQPVFDRQALLLVDFTRVRLTLVRPGTEPPQVALDTTIDFPSDQDTLAVPLTVPLSAGVTSEPFDLTLTVLNAAGAVVFRGGPLRVVATAGVLGGQATDVPMTYVGTGANAAGVRFRAPVPSTAFFGDTAVFVAEAYDSAGTAIAGTPVLYLVDPADTVKARVPDPTVGRVVAKSVRGPAAVVAQLLTGQTARTTLLVQPRPSAIALRSGGAQSAVIGATLAQPVVVRVTGSDGLGVQGASVTFAATSGGGSFTPGAAATDVNGDASASWTLGSLVGTQTATASVGAIVSGLISATGTPASASRLAFTVQPTTTTAGAAIAAVQVAAQDAFGNLYAAFTGTVTIALGANPGGATLSGTATAAAVAGVATFSGLTLDRSGTGYTLVASTQGLTGATSAGFTITAGAAATLALVSGGGQSALPSTLLPQPVVVKVTDALGNGVSGRAVAFAVVTGGGSVGTASATTDATGSASTTWTLGATPGAQTITATSTGLAGSPLTVSATAGSGIASTVVTPHFDTLTAFGATFRLTAQGYDQVPALVPGARFTWVSRNLAAVTVDTAGLVTAVANGSAYVVATEAGGTKDSALVVVQQRLATINVTPGARGIYLTGRFTFSASAVDGLGHPVAGVTSFTWSSTAPSVASVDTAGVVTANALGSTQIRATSGLITGVANVTVLTPITRIAVVVDTVGAVRTDTFTFTSLGLTRRYRAIAHDTLDAVMTGIAFTWVSTNGSVAVLDSVTGTTARATAAANGVTAIQATAQGFTSAPGASVTVAQVLAAILLTPPAPVIAITGSVGLVARGLDANGRFISGGSFIFRSATPAVATVDSVTGRVTGVALGTANITAASGAITSNPAVVLVSSQVAAALSFGRDTLSVGRGSSASIPILLSTPAASPLIVKLAVQDTFAYWSTPTVTIPAGQTAINATLNGRNAGTTIISATDSSGLGYAPTSAVLAVTATMRIASGGFAVNATDIAVTQVLLSDPSPAGGTYVSFGFSTPGIAAVSPDPAFIPEGQLAADIQIRGLAAGSTNITPRAIGVNGTPSSFTAYAAVLTLSQTSLMLGAGQYDPNTYVYVPTYLNTPVPVTITSSDTAVAVVPPTVTIPGGSYYAYFAISSRGTGSATVSVSSPGWTAAQTVAVRVTTPRLGIGGGGTLNTTSPATNVTVYAEDSLRSGHYRTNSLVVRLSSRDTAVMKVLDTLVTIAPGAYYNYGRVIPGGLGGTTYVIATASGHLPDSTLYTVVGPKLQFSWGQSYVGAGQYDPNQYVSTPNYVTAPLVVSVSNSNPTSVTIPAVDTIPTGSYYRYFTVTGNAPGAATFIASAPGHQPDTASYTVTSPRLTASGSGTYNNFGPGGNVYVYVADTLRSGHYRTAPLSVAVVSTDTNVIKVDSATVTIAAGQYYNGQAHVTPVGVGSARIIFTAAGHVTLDTLTITVQTPKIQFSFYSAMYGRRQNSGVNGMYVSTPDYRATPLAATITQKHATVDTLTTLALTIPTSSYYVYFGAYALANGVDTLIVSAPNYLPDTAFITVTTPRLTSSGLPGSTTTTNPPIGVTVYATDSVGTAHYVSDTVVVAAASSDSNVIRPIQRYFRILKGAYYASHTDTVMGPGTATITYSDSAGTGYLPTTTNAITVTGPSLTLGNGSPVLGMRQSGGTNSSYVYTPNNVATPLVVNLLSTGTRVATVPASVTIPAGSYIAYFNVTAQDTVGTIQIQATAVGYNGATMNVQVTQPRFVVSTGTQLNTTSPKTSITVYATDANGTAHYPTENVTVTLQSSDVTVAAIDSSTVTIPAGVYYVNTPTWTPGVIGSVQLSAQDVRAVYYKYGTGTVNVSVITPSLYFGSYPSALGIGQYQDNVYAYASDYQPAPLPVSFSHTGTARTGTFTNLTNTPVTGVTIPSGIYYQYFRMSGLVRGTDTLVASATSPAHNPATIYTVVDSGRVDPLGNWPTSIRAGDSVQVTLYARDPNTSTRNVVAATPFALAPNANIEFRSAGAVITTVTIPADAQSVTFYLKGVSAGTGSVTITSATYKAYTTTVTVTS